MVDSNLFIEWEGSKNELLKELRQVSFEDVEIIMRNNEVLAFESHSSDKYPHQFVAIVYIREYYYMVPFIFNKKESKIFLKTIIPSRKYKKKYEHMIINKL